MIDSVLLMVVYMIGVKMNNEVLLMLFDMCVVVLGSDVNGNKIVNYCVLGNG